MRRNVLYAAALTALLLVTGCAKQTDALPGQNTDYTYSARCGAYALVFTQRDLTVTDTQQVLTEPVTADFTTHTVCFANQKIRSDALFSEYSVFTLGELLGKILNDALPVQAEQKKDALILTGEYGLPFTLTLNARTGRPQTLVYGEQYVEFEQD